MNKTRRSHIVPKFYLKHFCVPGSERIWVGDLKTHQLYLAGISNVAVEKDFYAARGGEHEDELEERLSKIESNAAPLLQGFLSGEAEIPPDLGRFIAWLAARTMWLRRVTQETLPQYLRTKPELFREYIGSEKHGFEFEQISSGRRERLALKDALERVHDPSWRMHVHQDQHLDVIRWQAYLLQTVHFPTLSWVKVTAPVGHYLVTSDRPVSWDIFDIGLGDSPAALRHPLVELTVALDPSHALIAVHDSSALLARSLSATEINERTCNHAERYVYGCRKVDVEAQLHALRRGATPLKWDDRCRSHSSLTPFRFHSGRFY